MAVSSQGVAPIPTGYLYLRKVQAGWGSSPISPSEGLSPPLVFVIDNQKELKKGRVSLPAQKINLHDYFPYP
jgi:hypothetical protein